jgi:hypothetical protein
MTPEEMDAEADRLEKRADDLDQFVGETLRDDQGKDSKDEAQANIDEARQCRAEAEDLRRIAETLRRRDDG